MADDEESLCFLAPRRREILRFAQNDNPRWLFNKLLEGYSLVTSVPDVGFLVHEVNHRYMDNLDSIEGLRLTQFHGLGRLDGVLAQIRTLGEPVEYVDLRFRGQVVFKPRLR